MILLLAGTTEAREMAARLARSGVAAEALLAGAVADPLPLDLPTRIGGFGGEDGFRAFLADKGVTAVIDATHPFAARITARTARVCADLGLPHCILCRPAWQAGAGDDWREVSTPEDLPRVIPAGARIFLSVGRGEVGRYAGLKGRTVVLRSIDPPRELPDPDWQVVTGRPPFSVEDEKALFALTGIDWLVTKNAGGASGTAKLAAARTLGLPVAMIARPSLPEGATVVGTVEAAMDWVRAL
ncbi:cobalt-precorrin-6A reductase [Pseudooceanicola sp. LIPI14-2-Ac024]|uniref:cobalt-precorrin-6A reductase n=1 Tax=Pseudooceanicola sp. LIPI14-2-Ac024 TaxID=3344875 RepID=UPI0035CFA6A8